jgi:hypothetical protein
LSTYQIFVYFENILRLFLANLFMINFKVELGHNPGLIGILGLFLAPHLLPVLSVTLAAPLVGVPWLLFLLCVDEFESLIELGQLRQINIPQLVFETLANGEQKAQGLHLQGLQLIISEGYH